MSKERSVAFPHKQISHISVKSISSAFLRSSGDLVSGDLELSWVMMSL